jgi:hypothetical protein
VVDPYTGELKRVIPREEFETAPQFGGGPAAGPYRTGDLESLAYDDENDTLYAFSGNCCTSSALPTVFRLTRDPLTQQLHVDSYQPLPLSADYTGAAWRASTDEVYVGKGRRFRSYHYETNTSGPAFSISGVTGILGLDFTADGADLLVVTIEERLFRVEWAAKNVVAGWNIDLTPFDVRDSRGVEVIPSPTDPAVDQLYVYDGYSRHSDDPLRFAVFVFDVADGGGGGGGGGGEEDPGGDLVGNPGFETDTAGWDDSGVATLSRVEGGHEGSYAAGLTNTGTTSGNCVLNDKPNWINSTDAATYTGSMWVRGDSSGATLKLRFREYDGSTRVRIVVTSVGLTTAWQQVAVTINADAGHSLDLTAFVANAPPGTCFYADTISITSA